MARTPRYSPAQATFTPKDEPLAKHVEKEFQEIARTFEGEQDALSLAPLHAQPDRVVEGMVAFADGVHWNPGGGGKGFYGYYDGTWNRLG
jgi:hypothetical protein